MSIAAERLFLLSLLLFLGFRLLLSLAERCLQFPHLANKKMEVPKGKQNMHV
jgi:allophanate hydrolase subunit 1